MAYQSNVMLEIDKVSRTEWNSLIRTFRDSSFFQTWEYGTATWGEGNISHVLLKLDGHTVSAAQIGMSNLAPGLRYANISHGPMWKTKEATMDSTVLDLMVKGLAEEFVVKRRCSLRMFPFIHDGELNAIEIRNILSKSGFRCSTNEKKTIFMDLSNSLDDLRKGMRKTWRNYLNQAERAGLEVSYSKSLELLTECLKVYREMHGRKKFRENVNIESILNLHNELPEMLKFKALAVSKNGITQACLIWSAIADTAILIMAATSTSGLDCKASNLAYWEMIKRQHTEGIHWFDFGGIDPKGNPGVYFFKTGASGTKGLEVCYLGDFVCYSSNLARLLITTAKGVRYLCNLTKWK
jgi:lipid II:glycine glycyltransferase (peptidoglycan interpeptide bridge formation enzyme)